MSIKPPKDNNFDKAIALTKTVVEEIPLIPIGTELLSWFIKTPHQKRIDKWQQEVSDTLNDLQNKGISLEELKDNEEFLDILFQAIPIGIRNHQEAKRNALKNAIINIAANNAPDFAIQKAFLNYIDVLSIWHINLLILMNDPVDFFNKRKMVIPSFQFGGIDQIILTAYPELKGQQGYIKVMWSDLYNKGFFTSDKQILDSTISGNGMLNKRTTNLGETFIKFITS